MWVAPAIAAVIVAVLLGAPSRGDEAAALTTLAVIGLLISTLAAGDHPAAVVLTTAQPDGDLSQRPPE